VHLEPGAAAWGTPPGGNNRLGWFNRVSDAVDVVPEPDRSRFRLFAYRIHPEVFRRPDGEHIAVILPDGVQPEPLSDGFTSIGFDSVNRFAIDSLQFECSPLSCNFMAKEMPVNEHCLFPAFDDAIAGAQRFAVEQPEPGDYYVVEVLEGPRIEPSRSTNADRAST
jgi:hypothetical protein